jgi:outer membrane protein TolC
MLNDSSRYLENLQNLDLIIIRLNRLTGLDLTLEFEPSDSLSENELPQLAQLLDYSADRNTAVLLGQQDLELAINQLKNTRARHAPTIGVNLGYDYANLTSEAGFLLSNRNYGLSYGIGAQWNIFNGLQTMKARQSAKILQEGSQLRLEDVLDEVETQVLSQYRSHAFLMDQIEIERVNVLVAEENLNIAQEKYRLGSLSGIEFRTIQNQWLLSKERLLMAQLQVQNTALSLLQLSGGLL